ncbi:hypothetical protein GCM10010399_14550 [Dactylosporangium fulvum]|uniref:DUF2752 domain-containing protein n=1 Tax=Dactylosporangium fulvum TaxID=53359 RepID=A0ABY5VWU8_9ACTN|nr:DUF2752 domain-containing protein [Dactylosporangium fulvum]UWP80261.1 DUF2752 domain-containing protein [Dactylosporangium fulvum]
MNTAPTLRRRSGWVRYIPLWLLTLPAGWFAYVLAYNPTDRVADPTGPCLWHAVFGIDGPTCGITRMTWYLLHGDLIDAARMHLAALLLVPIGAYAYLWWAGGWILGVQLPMLRISTKLAIGYAAFFLLYATVLRNLPWSPFTWFYVPNLT